MSGGRITTAQKFGEDLEAILFSNSFDESPESASVVTETSSEMQTEWRTWGSLVDGMLQHFQEFKRAAASFFIKTQQKYLHDFDYEVNIDICKQWIPFP